jgi:hypothetical protein
VTVIGYRRPQAGGICSCASRAADLGPQGVLSDIKAPCQRSTHVSCVHDHWRRLLALRQHMNRIPSDETSKIGIVDTAPDMELQALV